MVSSSPKVSFAFRFLGYIYKTNGKTSLKTLAMQPSNRVPIVCFICSQTYRHYPNPNIPFTDTTPIKWTSGAHLIGLNPIRGQAAKLVTDRLEMFYLINHQTSMTHV